MGITRWGILNKCVAPEGGGPAVKLSVGEGVAPLLGGRERGTTSSATTTLTLWLRVLTGETVGNHDGPDRGGVGVVKPKQLTQNGRVFRRRLLL